MSRSLGNVIADSLSLGLGYAERLLVDVDAGNFGRLASPGSSPIESNHPAFIYGHLSLISPLIIQQVGGRADVQTPDGFAELFSKDAQCRDDPEGEIYPAMDVVTSCFFDGYRAAATALQECDDDVLQEPNPIAGRLTELFPTKGSVLTFFAGGHMMMHLGQMSAWRRMMGLGAA